MTNLGTHSCLVDLTPPDPDTIPDLTQDDIDCFTIEDFLRLVIRLTGEPLLINISIKAHFMQLGVNPELYEVSYNALPCLSFNLRLR